MSGPDEYEIRMSLCESPMEREFLRQVFKSRSLFRLEQQVEIGSYRCDFVLNGCAVEIDGAEFHEFSRDKARDAELLRSGRISKLIRIPAASVWYQAPQIMSVIKAWIGLSEFIPLGAVDVTNWRRGCFDAMFETRKEFMQSELWMSFSRPVAVVGSATAWRAIAWQSDISDSTKMMHKLTCDTLDTIQDRSDEPAHKFESERMSKDNRSHARIIRQRDGEEIPAPYCLNCGGKEYDEDENDRQHL